MKSIRRFPLLPACTAAVVLIAIHLLAQTAGKKTVDLPEELTDQVKKDFESPDCLENSGRSLEGQIRTEEVDLTKTVGAALLVTGLGPCMTTAAGNSPFLIYARFGNNWRKVLGADGDRVLPLANMYTGWHALEVTYRNSETETAHYIYRFTKTEYRAQSCELVVSDSRSEKSERKPCPGWKSK